MCAVGGRRRCGRGGQLGDGGGILGDGRELLLPEGEAGRAGPGLALAALLLPIVSSLLGSETHR